jgi:arabinan endo-1,5-alpha-L-arabinosidase
MKLQGMQAAVKQQGWMQRGAAALAMAVLAGLGSGCNSSSTQALTATQVTLTESTSSVNVGGSVTLTATFSGGSGSPAAIGTIVFADGGTFLQGVTLQQGNVVSATVTGLTIGAHNFTASYLGDQTHAPSTSSVVTLSTYDPTSLTIASNLKIAGVGDPIVLTVTAADASTGGTSIPTGNVTFYVTANGATSPIGTAALATVSGTATATLPYTIASPTGTQTFTASLGANGYFLGSTSGGVAVTVHPPLTQDTVTLSGSLTNPATIAAGTADTITATILPVNTTKGTPTGTVTFYDGTVVIGSAALNSTGTSATLTTKQFVAGAAANTITAFYTGDANYAPNYSTNSLSVTVSPYTGATYTNPLNLTDTVNNTGKVYNCPDPAIYKYQVAGVNTWYAYCTGDAFNSADTVNGNFRAHLISIFQSSDLVNWTYVRDAFTTLPSWIATGNELQTPAIKFINGQYLLYYEAPAVKASPGGSAIGVGYAATPAGPFTDSGGPVVNQQIACGGGCNRTVFSPEVIADQTGQLWIAYGGVFAGLSIRQLSANGLTSNAGTEVNIAVDNYYTNPYLLYKNGYYYEFATPAGSCCGGAFSTYSVRVGRSKSITGPYLDAEGNDMNAFSATSGTNGAPGGDTVLVNTGNTIFGPGSNTTFTDEAGQDYILYSGVSSNQQYLPNVTGYTARQLMMDPLDYVNGWPVVRNGTGDSDQPQPVPAAQPNASNGYIPPAYNPDTPGTALAAYSQDFAGATALGSQFSFLHASGVGVSCLDPGNGFAGIPGVAAGLGTTGYTLCSNFDESTNVPGTSYSMSGLPILAEAEPTGNYMVEVKMHSFTPPTGCCSYNYPAQGLMIYSTDTMYLRLDDFSDYDTRQLEFLDEFGSSGTSAFTAFAPAGTPHNSAFTYLRLVKRITNQSTGAATYTSYSSVDGVNYVRGPAWNVSYGNSAKIGIFADNLGEGATFSYIHVSTVLP